MHSECGLNAGPDGIAYEDLRRRCQWPSIGFGLCIALAPRAIDLAGPLGGTRAPSGGQSHHTDQESAASYPVDH
jgi:hypothetical protein